ncbi:CsbD family protein, partial [Oenococcus oeni]
MVKNKGVIQMEDMFKKLIKVTVIGSLITTSVMIAGTILVVKKIDDSGDKIEDKKDSFKDRITGAANVLMGKATND